MPSPVAICTIIAKNYLASARTLCESVHHHHPDVPFYVLFVDDTAGFVTPDAENFHVLSPAQIAIPDFNHLAFRYDVVELATSVKPHLLRYLLEEKGHEKAIYFDPDIMVFNPLDEIFLALDENEVLLTPHTFTDYPDDGKTPTLETILRNGIYNLGFIAIKKAPESLDLLHWWDEKLQKYCTRDFSTAYFVDQRVIDVAPVFFGSVRILQSPGYNVAYWNLHERQLTFETGQWRSNGENLAFFHFSSFDPSQSSWLAQNCSRIPLNEGSDLQRLCRIYAQGLLKNDFSVSRTWPYQHNRLRDGASITYTARRLFRQTIPWQRRIANPFDSKQVRWINGFAKIGERFLYFRLRLKLSFIRSAKKFVLKLLR